MLILINVFSAKTFAIVKPTSDFYVNDYAEILNTNTKNYIINTNKSLNSKTGAQIVVVTIPSLDGSSLEEYSNQLFRNFGIGDKNKNNGVLLLLALQERQFRVEVGYGLEGVLPDGKTGRIQDEYIIPYLKQNKWDEGIKNGFNAILQIVAKEYNVDIEAEDAVTVNNGIEEKDMNEMAIFIFVSTFLGSILGILKNERIIKVQTALLIAVIYILILSIIQKIFFIQKLEILMFFIEINSVITILSIFICGVTNDSFGGRGSSGGGGSSRSF